MFNQSEFACAARIAGKSMIGGSETPTSPVQHTCHLAKPSCIEEGPRFVTVFRIAGRAVRSGEFVVNINCARKFSSLRYLTLQSRAWVASVTSVIPDVLTATTLSPSLNSQCSDANGSPAAYAARRVPAITRPRGSCCAVAARRGALERPAVLRKSSPFLPSISAR